MESIISNFNRYFANWEIELPAEAVANRQGGKIMQAGWIIWYVFGEDESGEYLDFLAAHRMTNDRHERIYADGRTEALETQREMRRVSSDPEEDARLKEEYYEHNRRVGRELDDKFQRR